MCHLNTLRPRFGVSSLANIQYGLPHYYGKVNFEMY